MRLSSANQTRLLEWAERKRQSLTNNTGLGGIQFQGKFDTSTNFSDGASLVVTTAEVMEQHKQGSVT